MFDYRGLNDVLFLMLYIGAGCLALVAAGRLRPVHYLLYICAAAVRPLAARQLCRPGAQGGVAEPHLRPRALRHLHALHVEHGRPRPRVSLAGAHRGHRGVPRLARRDAAGAGVERILFSGEKFGVSLAYSYLCTVKL